MSEAERQLTECRKAIKVAEEYGIIDRASELGMKSMRREESELMAIVAGEQQQRDYARSQIRYRMPSGPIVITEQR